MDRCRARREGGQRTRATPGAGPRRPGLVARAPLRIPAAVIAAIVVLGAPLGGEAQARDGRETRKVRDAAKQEKRPALPGARVPRASEGRKRPVATAPEIVSVEALEPVYPLSASRVRVVFANLDAFADPGDLLSVRAAVPSPCGSDELSGIETATVSRGTVLVDLRVTFPRSADGGQCPLEIAVWPREGGEAVTLTSPAIEVAAMRVHRIAETWALQPYLEPRVSGPRLGEPAPPGCAGPSVGPAGAHAVGLLERENDIAWSVRSGPGSAQCRLRIPERRLARGWAVEHLDWTNRSLNAPNACQYVMGVPPEDEGPWPDDPGRAPRSLGRIDLQVRCAGSVTNAHGHELELEEVELYGPADVDWHQAMEDDS